MKTYIKKLGSALIILFLHLLVVHALAQEGPPIGTISTNPINPINTHSPSELNYFDWTANNYALNWIRNNFTTTIPSPFYQLNNPITNNLLDSKDMLYQDGWELITKDNGYADNGTASLVPVTNPHLVLYNKYTGTMRIFFIIGDRKSDYNSISVKVNFFASTGSNSFAPSLLNLSSGEVTPLMAPFSTTPPKFTSVNTYYNSADLWVYADFPMSYDPCTCLYDSKLIITPYLSVNFTIDATGTTTGKIVDLNSSTKKVDQNLSFDELIQSGPQKASQFFKSTTLMAEYIKRAFDGDFTISSDDKNKVKSEYYK